MRYLRFLSLLIMSLPSISAIGGQKANPPKQPKILWRLRTTGELAIFGFEVQMQLYVNQWETEPAIQKNLLLEAALSGRASVERDDLIELKIGGKAQGNKDWTKSTDGYDFVVLQEMDFWQPGASSIAGSSRTISISEKWKLEKPGQTAPIGEWKIAYKAQDAYGAERKQHFLNILKETVAPARAPIISAICESIFKGK